jgi:hypothetical protein
LDLDGDPALADNRNPLISGLVWSQALVFIGPPSGVVKEYKWYPSAIWACNRSITVDPGATFSCSAWNDQLTGLSLFAYNGPIAAMHDTRSLVFYA